VLGNYGIDHIKPQCDRIVLVEAGRARWFSGSERLGLAAERELRTAIEVHTNENGWSKSPPTSCAWPAVQQDFTVYRPWRA
jgi:hypothetical protein